MKNKNKQPDPGMQKIMHDMMMARQTKRSKQNTVTGWLFAGSLFLAGFIVGALIF